MIVLGKKSLTFIIPIYSTTVLYDEIMMPLNIFCIYIQKRKDPKSRTLTGWYQELGLQGGDS